MRDNSTLFGPSQEEKTGEQSISIENVTVLRATPPFDDVSVKTVREWVFRPAQRNGVRAPAVVYVVFAFRAPVQAANRFQIFANRPSGTRPD